MGKKSRRRDDTKKGPSAAEKNQAKIVSNIEKGDPSYLHFHKLPNALSRIVVKRRFGGTDPWGGRSVKITAALVRKRRFERRLCHNCPACAHLATPRYQVCSGCGVARYCSLQCQREHWPRHQEECLACQELARRWRQREILAQRGIHTGDTSDDDGDGRTSDDEEDDSLHSLPSDSGSDA